MMMPPIFSRFKMGVLVITREAETAMSIEEIFWGLARHCSGDWSDMDVDDWRENADGCDFSGRVFSQFRSSKGTRFWIITEEDRSKTTVLLPEDH